MFIIWGFRNLLLTIGSGMFFCPTCRSEQKFRHRRFKRFFTLYFIPIIPLNDGEQFVECTTCKSKFNAAPLLESSRARESYSNHHPLFRTLLILSTLILFACVGLIALGTIAERDTAEKKAVSEVTRVALIDSYGRNTLDLCANAEDASTWPSYPAPRLLVVNKATQEIITDLNAQLPVSMKATGKDDLTHVMCISMSSKDYATDEYSDSSGKVVYTCTRIRRVWDVYVVDVKTGKTSGEKVFLGSLPPECPEKANKDLTQYGDDPVLDKVLRDISSAVEG